MKDLFGFSAVKFWTALMFFGRFIWITATFTFLSHFAMCAAYDRDHKIWFEMYPMAAFPVTFIWLCWIGSGIVLDLFSEERKKNTHPDD